MFYEGYELILSIIACLIIFRIIFSIKICFNHVFLEIKYFGQATLVHGPFGFWGSDN